MNLENNNNSGESSVNNSSLPPLTEKEHKEIELREQDRWLPIANVARLMKNTLPTTAKVSKDAKECMQECVSEFISFITSESSDKCLSEKRKTINGEDILFAMSSLGFENYSEILKIYLAKYREQQALKQERGETKRPKEQNNQQNGLSGSYEEQQQLEREITNIPLHGEDELDIGNHMHHDLLNSMNGNVDEDELLSLEEHHQQNSLDDNSEEASTHVSTDHYNPNGMKTEGEDGVLYEYTNEHY
ncbi:Nuclear transcription factor Y subunit B-8 [Wickerhamomyces ciferrii]|uniref:Nuclear transcription factor Y subunit B-8 n=1 Tax=Wickerhamomyces ciferrii (strain ATCC 14091 / BCRC 22168 / CBS 111 / JCM 3599 / NBRC 0793 / NRRL Y-1031 F-60-10) TaxID=1206466 RepID=K0KV01_WICCF|nr:Nuclear transcription factor Y subunit B-8 [Wickerhamomyces ciferrii]CCH45737.1 Nuclear transcription factor Y subunit B-8 [Wickerhamomyces ciferrii]